MKKSIIEVNYNKWDENSVIVFKEGKWIAISKTAFLDVIHKELNNLYAKIDTERQEREDAINSINEQLERIGNVLQYILGEEPKEPNEEPSEEPQEEQDNE